MPHSPQSDATLTDQVRKKIERFTRKEGRRPRILIGSMKPLKLDTDTLKTAKSLAELGLDIDIGPLNQSAGQIACTAIENDVHFICLVSANNNHQNSLEDVEIELKKSEAGDIAVVRQKDIFASDRILVEAVNHLLDKLEERTKEFRN